MIEGLQVEMSSEYLVKHLNTRGKYHKDRSSWYAGQVRNLSSGGLMPEAVSVDPINAMERKKKEHKDKAGYFYLLAEHIIPNETYRLTDTDLARLEFAARYY